MVTEVLTAIITLLKKLYDSIKGTEKVEKIDRPKSNSDKKQINKFLNETPGTVIFNVGGDLYLGDSTRISHEDDKIINMEFLPDKTANKRVDIMDTDFFERVEQFETEAVKDPKLDNFVEGLEPQLRTILKLSVYVKKLFDESNSEMAQRVKSDIGKQYGKDGRKLCNLYLSGYIDGLIEFFTSYYDRNETQIKSKLSEHIRSLVKQSDVVFFIHSHSNESQEIGKIASCMNRAVPYIALHGANANIRKVRKIVETLNAQIMENGYELEENLEKTPSLCPLLNVYLTKVAKTS